MNTAVIMLLLPLSPAEAEAVPIVVEFGVPTTTRSTPSAGDRGPFSGGVNEKPLAVPHSSYADVLERVKVGERLVFVAPLRGFPGSPGTYDAWLDPARGPMLERRAEVVATRPFSGAGRGTTRTTAVPNAVTSRPPERGLGSYGAGSGVITYILVPGAGLLGSTNCPPSG